MAGKTRYTEPASTGTLKSTQQSPKDIGCANNQQRVGFSDAKIDEGEASEREIEAAYGISTGRLMISVTTKEQLLPQ